MPWNGEPGSGPPALMEGTDPAAGAAPAGEDSWKLLAHGGLGLSLWPYEPGTAGGTAVLQRMKSLEEVASDIPFHRRPVRVPGVKSDGFFYRYGRMMVGWAAPDASGNLSLPPLGRARRRVRVWDPVQSQPVVELLLAGNDQHVRVPHGLGRVFVEIDAA